MTVLNGTEYATHPEHLLPLAAQLLTLRVALGWKLALAVITLAVLWTALQELYDLALSARLHRPRPHLQAPRGWE